MDLHIVKARSQAIGILDEPIVIWIWQWLGALYCLLQSYNSKT